MSNYIILFVALCTLFSCSLLDDKESLPSYLYIEGADFVSRTGEGTSDQAIYHSWININGDFVGAFENPRLIPLNYEGNVECIVNPGIFSNGISSLYEINEVMTPYKLDVELVRGEVDTIYPVFYYDETAGFSLINDFDNDQHDFNEDIDGDAFTRMIPTSRDAYSGKSGVIRLTTDHRLAVMTTKFDLENLPIGSGQKILEVHYKNDVPVEFGFRFYDNGSPIDFFEYGLNPSEEWNKVYINYTELINRLDASRIRILIRAALPADMEEGFVYFDNLKFTYEN